MHQGSVLGPLLLVKYINDIPNVSKSLSFYLFADDTNIYFDASDTINPISTGGKCFPRKFCLPVDNFLNFGSIATKFGDFS